MHPLRNVGKYANYSEFVILMCVESHEWCNWFQFKRWDVIIRSYGPQCWHVCIHVIYKIKTWSGQCLLDENKPQLEVLQPRCCPLASLCKHWIIYYPCEICRIMSYLFFLIQSVCGVTSVFWRYWILLFNLNFFFSYVLFCM